MVPPCIMDAMHTMHRTMNDVPPVMPLSCSPAMPPVMAPCRALPPCPCHAPPVVPSLHAPCHAPLSCPPSCHAPDVRSPSCVPAAPSLCHAPVVPSPSCIPLCVPLVLAACEMKFTGQLYRAPLPCPYCNFIYVLAPFLEEHIDVGLADSHRGRWRRYAMFDAFIFPNLLPLADNGEAQHRVKTSNIKRHMDILIFASYRVIFNHS